MKKVYKFNYLYKLTLISDPRYYYFGIRSTDTQPEFDRYNGSGRAIGKLKKQGLDFYKEIVENFETREEVEIAEEKAIGTLWKVDPYCLNRSKGGQKGGKFDASGLYRVFKNQESRLIDPEALDRFEQEGWQRGVSPEIKQKLSTLWKGTHRDPEIVEKIRKTKLSRGCRHSEETKKKISKANRGRKHDQEYRDRIQKQKSNTVWVSLEDKTKLVKLEIAQQLLEQGWVYGRKSYKRK